MSEEFFALFICGNVNLAFAQEGPKANGRRLFMMDNNPLPFTKTMGASEVAKNGLSLCNSRSWLLRFLVARK